MISTAQDDLRAFQGRKYALRRIKRYHTYGTMLYRSHVEVHARHVAWIVSCVNPLLTSRFPSYNPTLALAMALVHDDAEMLTGDYSAGIKSKMSREELEDLKRKEETAAYELARQYPTTVAGFRYHDLLLAVIRWESLEAQVVHFADRLDGFGEALHEVMAGNICFVTNIVNRYGTIPIPTKGYTDYFQRFASLYSSLAFLVEGPDKVLDLGQCLEMNWKALAASRQPHTRASLMQPTGFQPYDLWKSIVLQNADRREIRRLITPVE